jgi:hypothetical protein
VDSSKICEFSAVVPTATNRQHAIKSFYWLIILNRGSVSANENLPLGNPTAAMEEAATRQHAHPNTVARVLPRNGQAQRRC